MPIDWKRLPQQAVLPLGDLRVSDLQEQALAHGQRWLHVDCQKARGKSGVMSALAKGLQLPPHFGANLDALYDCVTDLEPTPGAAQAGLVIVIENLPASRTFGPAEQAGLLEVFEDAAADFATRSVALRVFHSIAG